MVGEVLQRAGSGKLFADLRHARISWATAGAAEARKRTITGIQVHGHITAIGILLCYKGDLPCVTIDGLHI